MVQRRPRAGRVDPARALTGDRCARQFSILVPSPVYWKEVLP